jgi:hypothetical protein
MTKATDDEVRRLFTEIGCIMEDASLVALVWRTYDKLDAQARYRKVSDAHAEIGKLLAQIANVI